MLVPVLDFTSFTPYLYTYRTPFCSRVWKKIGACLSSCAASAILELIGVSPPEDAVSCLLQDHTCLHNIPVSGIARAENVNQAGLTVDQPYSLCGQIGNSGGLVIVSLITTNHGSIEPVLFLTLHLPFLHSSLARFSAVADRLLHARGIRRHARHRCNPELS